MDITNASVQVNLKVLTKQTRTVSQISKGYPCPAILIISLDFFSGLTSFKHILMAYTTAAV